MTPVIQAAEELTSAEWSRLRGLRKVPAEHPNELAAMERRVQRRRLELLVRSFVQALGPANAQCLSADVIPWDRPLV